MQNPETVCPECSLAIGGKNTHSVYFHAVSCFHLPGKGPELDLEAISSDKSRSTEHVRRASKLLTMAMNGGKQ